MALLWGFAFNVPLNVHNRKGEGEESGKGGAWVWGWVAKWLVAAQPSTVQREKTIKLIHCYTI